MYAEFIRVARFDEGPRLSEISLNRPAVSIRGDTCAPGAWRPGDPGNTSEGDSARRTNLSG